MSLTVQDLFTAPTSAQIRTAMVANLITLGIPADQWRAGGVASTMLTVASMSIALLGTLIATLIQGFFLPTATGNSLKLLALYMYGITLPVATYATGVVRLTNSGGGVYTLGVGEYTALNPTTKVTYTNTTAFVIPSGGTVGAQVIATTVGSAGNSAAGSITVNVTTLIGVTVTNVSALVGVDAPSDEAIRTLCINKLGALSVRGVRTAYAYAIQTAVNTVTLAAVNINRWRIQGASSTGIVSVVVASPTGAPIGTDLDGVSNSIEEKARPEAVTVYLQGAVPIAYGPTITFWCTLPPGITSAVAKTAVDDALITALAVYPIGGVTATDDTHLSPVQGLFATFIYGVIAKALSDIGGSMLSAQGGTDLIMANVEVAANSITTVARVAAPVSGTLVP